MTHALVLCGVLLAVGSGASAAGLRCALDTALTGLQAAEVTAAPNATDTTGFKQSDTLFATEFLQTLAVPLGEQPVSRNGLQLSFGGVVHLPDGTITTVVAPTPREQLFNSIERQKEAITGGVFIDTDASTLGNGVFGPGPQLFYDRGSGGLSINAPPLLAEGDEFGQKHEYTPETIRINFGDRRAPTVAFPVVERLVRNEPDPFALVIDLNQPPPPPLTDDSPSFVPAEPLEPNFIVAGSVLTVNAFFSSRMHGAFNLSVDQLLIPGLSDSVFAIDPRLFTDDGVAVPPDDLFVDLLEQLGETGFPVAPEVSVEVTYRLTNRFIGDSNLRSQFRLLAVPVAVPEPNAVAIALLGFVAASLLRSAAPSVA